jgi:hypothetical protein
MHPVCDAQIPLSESPMVRNGTDPRTELASAERRQPFFRRRPTYHVHTCSYILLPVLITSQKRIVHGRNGSARKKTDEQPKTRLVGTGQPPSERLAGTTQTLIANELESRARMTRIMSTGRTFVSATPWFPFRALPFLPWTIRIFFWLRPLRYSVVGRRLFDSINCSEGE